MLELRDICKEYRTGDTVQKALDHVSLTLADTEFVAILGPSGSGKSYIAQAIENAACRKFKKVKYIRMPTLLDELATAKATGEFRDTIKSY